MAKYEEIRDRITKAMSEDDGGVSSMTDILAEIEKDYAELETAREAVDDLTAKNQSLHDTNMKLFLAQTAAAEEEEEEEEKEETLETILEALEKEES
ncbi:MAG: hypothetical protein J6Q80_07655 [Lentisphaeria bacterium]|nr:hypothetical protein [Lentisphaeria bacterium]